MKTNLIVKTGCESLCIVFGTFTVCHGKMDSKAGKTGCDND